VVKRNIAKFLTEVAQMVDSSYRDGIKIEGRLLAESFDPQGNLKKSQYLKNTVPDVGEIHIADQLAASPGETAMTKMSVGTGTTVTDETATALNTIIAGWGTDQSISSRTHTNQVITYVCTFTAGAGGATVTEACINNTDGTPILLTYNDGLSQALNENDTLQITWTLTIS